MESLTDFSVLIMENFEQILERQARVAARRHLPTVGTTVARDLGDYSVL